MTNAPTDGYDELFLTTEEKKRLADIGRERGLDEAQRRKLAKSILSNPPKQPKDIERIERIKERQEQEWS